MNEESLIQEVYHLREVEKLTQCQIAEKLNIGRKRVRGILGGLNEAKPIAKKMILDEYVQLIIHWYKEYPRLKASQVYERLKSYGYQGSYPTVARLSCKHRQTKHTVYHPLTFVPGEEAQVDWFFFNHETLGQIAGFLYVLSYSRYAWGVFYPKTTFEFFLAGHIECLEHIGGSAHTHRYDNIKSVVLTRHPETKYNPQFLDFSRYYGFSIYLCNPYKGNEKGRVERVIRDIRVFLYAEEFIDLNDLNKKFHQWLIKRNNTVHRSTTQTPQALLSKERLIFLPPNVYLPRRIIRAVASKTALVEFETNKYSVPSSWTAKKVEIIVYPDRIEICMTDKRTVNHKRCFDKKQIIQNPLHAEKLLNRTPQFKMQRIHQLIVNMDSALKDFILHQDDDNQRIQAAYQIFHLLKTHSKTILISAVRELNLMKCSRFNGLGVHDHWNTQRVEGIPY